MYNILLVEDDRITSKLIQKYILDIGYYLAGAVSSGEEAVQIINEKEPDLPAVHRRHPGRHRCCSLFRPGTQRATTAVRAG